MGEAAGAVEDRVTTVLRIIDGFFFDLVAAIAVWSSDRNQRTGDIAARTIVAPR